ISAEHIAILADVLVKHATPLAAVSLAHATADTLRRGGADAVIVTGNATGDAVDPTTLIEVAQADPGAPVFLGSGVTEQNDAKLAVGATGAIVGSWLKRDGVLAHEVDVDRVRALRQTLDQVWGYDCPFYGSDCAVGTQPSGPCSRIT